MFNKVIIITVDALRADRVKAYGGTGLTKNIDQLAERGVVFRNAISPGNCTLPGHGTIFTGLYPKNHGLRLNGWKFKGQVPSVAEIFQNKGYKTCGNSSIEYITGYLGFARGYDKFFECNPFTKNYALISRFRIKIGRYTFRAINFFKNHKILQGEAYKNQEKVTSELLPWIEENKNEKFFIWAHYHGGHVDKKEDQEKLGKKSDEEIGKLIAKLEKLNILDETLIIIVADHGEGLSEHGKTGHGWVLYDEELKVPMIFYAKGKFGPKVIENQVSTADILPTIIDYQGFDRITSDGNSLKRLIEGNETNFKENVFCENYPDHHKAFCLRTADGWKLIKNENGSRELYNIKNDPKEKVNLVEIEKREASKLSKMLDEWIATGKKLEEQMQKREAHVEESLKKLGYL